MWYDSMIISFKNYMCGLGADSNKSNIIFNDFINLYI